MTPKRILVFKHMACQNPGVFRGAARANGVEFFEVDLHAGDSIPSLDDFDGIWAMGGSMNVWQEDRFAWLVQEKETIRHAVAERKMPYLGICLGHQLLAEALGGTVEPMSRPEVGLFEIVPTMEGVGHPIFRGRPGPSLWVNVHLAEVTEAPGGAVILASSPACRNQVMQIGENAYSCQFHPEVCGHTVAEWMKIPGMPEGLERLLGPEGVASFRSTVAENLAAHNEAALGLFENWCRLVFPPG